MFINITLNKLRFYKKKNIYMFFFRNECLQLLRCSNSIILKSGKKREKIVIQFPHPHISSSNSSQEDRGEDQLQIVKNYGKPI